MFFHYYASSFEVDINDTSSSFAVMQVLIKCAKTKTRKENCQMIVKSYHSFG